MGNRAYSHGAKENSAYSYREHLTVDCAYPTNNQYEVLAWNIAS